MLRQQQQHDRHFPLMVVAVVVIGLVAFGLIWSLAGLVRNLTVSPTAYNPVADMSTHALSPQWVAYRNNYEPSYAVSAYDAYGLPPEWRVYRANYEPSYAVSAYDAYGLSPEWRVYRANYEPSYAVSAYDAYGLSPEWRAYRDNYEPSYLP